MAALNSLDSLTEVDREHLAPLLHAGPTTARSTALQYVMTLERGAFERATPYQVAYKRGGCARVRNYSASVAAATMRIGCKHFFSSLHQRPRKGLMDMIGTA